MGNAVGSSNILKLKKNRDPSTESQSNQYTTPWKIVDIKAVTVITIQSTYKIDPSIAGILINIYKNTDMKPKHFSLAITPIQCIQLSENARI